VDVFIAGEALAAGRVTRHQLALEHRRVLPDVYAPKRVQLSLDDRITAAWLWSRRRGVVVGAAASAMHGARWVGADVPIELNLPNNKPPAGVVTRNDTLLADEVVQLRGVPVTTPPRTAFNLARRGPVGKAVARLDALARATHFAGDEVLAVAARHLRVRGRRRVPDVLAMVDEGAQSPKETWLRLLLIEAGGAALTLNQRKLIAGGRCVARLSSLLARAAGPSASRPDPSGSPARRAWTPGSPSA
jgi:hypothetical protein